MPDIANAHYFPKAYLKFDLLRKGGSEKKVTDQGAVLSISKRKCRCSERKTSEKLRAGPMWNIRDVR